MPSSSSRKKKSKKDDKSNNKKKEKDNIFGEDSSNTITNSRSDQSPESPSPSASASASASASSLPPEGGGEEEKLDDFANEQTTQNDSSNQKEHREKKKRSSTRTDKRRSKSKRSEVDPVGYVSRSVPVQEYNDAFEQSERFPLTTAQGSSTKDVISINDLEECVLFHDSFTFLMTAKYPLEFCCSKPPPVKQPHEVIAAIDIEEELDDDSELQRKKSRLERANADFLCLPFWVGFFINVSQLFIYTVVIANVFFRSVLPPNADRWLRLAQIFAVLVTLYTQSDFIDGIFLLTERWKAFKGITTPIKFNVSAIARVFAGLVGIVSTFILVVYSTEVVDLLLNFTAMEFVATLDGSAFEIASKGFLGATLEKKCLQIQEFRYQRRTQRGSLTRLFAYIFCVILVFASFITIVILQSSRKVGVHNEIYVQFDDTFVPDLFGVTGVYLGCQGFRTKLTGEVAYVDISYDGRCPVLGEDGNFQGDMFVYCWKLDGWVYITQPTKKPCDDFIMRSFLDEAPVASDSFDILTHAKANWVVRRSDTGGENLLDFVFIENVGAFKNTFKGCEGQGLLPLHSPLAKRQFDQLPEDHTFSPDFDGTLYPKIFDLMYRPIFRKEILTQKQKFQVVLFDGLRWHWLALNPSAYAKNITRELECDDDDDDCWKVFIKYFHRERAWIFNPEISVLFAVSDPMKYLTPEDTGIPMDDLVWYEPVIANGRLRPGKTIDKDSDLVESLDGKFGFECANKPSDCDSDEVPFIVELSTDHFPYETAVYMFFGEGESDVANLTVAKEAFADLNQNFIIEEDALVDMKFTDSSATYHLETCIKVDQPCVQIMIIDDVADGLFSGGGYEISYGKESVRNIGNGPFTCRLYQFGASCETNQDPQPCNYTQILLDYPGRTESGNDSPFTDDDFESDFDPESTALPDSTFYPTGTYDPSQYNPSQDFAPTASPIACGPEEASLRIRIDTDFFPSETRVLVFFGQGVDDIGSLSMNNQMRIYEPDITFEVIEGAVTDFTFEGFDTQHILQSCVPYNENMCIQVVLVDTEFDGISVSGGYYIKVEYESFLAQAFKIDSSPFSCRPFQMGPGCVGGSSVEFENPEECSLSQVLADLPFNV